MTKEEALEILNNYLENQKKIDSSDEHHLYLEEIKEHNFCWEIPHTSKEYFDYQDIRLMPVGAGPFLIDKENGKIYETGSAPINWVKDFELMKLGKQSDMIWTELKNYFLDVQFNILLEKNLISITQDVKYEQINAFMEDVFRSFKNDNENGSPIIKRLNYNEFQSTFLVSYPKGSVIKENIDFEEVKMCKMSSISLLYSLEPYYSFIGPLNEIKDWLKLNKEYKTTDNYWVENMETDLNKPFEKWNLKMTLEIKRT